MSTRPGQVITELRGWPRHLVGEREMGRKGEGGGRERKERDGWIDRQTGKNRNREREIDKHTYTHR